MRKGSLGLGRGGLPESAPGAALEHSGVDMLLLVPLTLRVGLPILRA